MIAEDPLTSCVIPVFNGERFIAEAIDSVLAQTCRPIEVIVADDGSTDRTVEIVAGYGDAVRLVTQATAGPPATRNLGLAAATGEYVAFLDADDLWHEEKLARQFACLMTGTKPDACVTHVELFWMPELAEEEAELGNQPRGKVVAGYVAGTLLAPRAIFDRVGGFNTRLWFSDGADWFMRAGESGVTVELLNDVLCFHRMHGKNLTRRRVDDSREEFLGIAQARLRRRREQGDTTPPTRRTVAGKPDND